MIGIPALEAHLIAALANNLVALPFSHEMIAVWTGTPSEVRIDIHVNVFLELQIFLINLLGAKLSYIFSGILLLASLIRTFDNPYLAICDVEL